VREGARLIVWAARLRMLCPALLLLGALCRCAAPPAPTATRVAATTVVAQRASTSTPTLPAPTVTVLPPSATSRPITATPTASPTPATTSTASPSPVATQTATPTLPQPTSTPTPAVWVRETSLSLPTYPYEAYLRTDVDPLYNIPFRWLDRGAYDAARPAPTPRLWRAIVLENAYLRLTILPELGGRLYECVFKPSGRNIFYQNAVLKPSYWGPLARERNWWLAAGGMEWAFPVQEHGYEWGEVWQSQVRVEPSRVAVIVQDSDAADRPQVQVEISLTAGEAAFRVSPRLMNPTSRELPIQFWLNAALTLGADRVPPDTEFALPAAQVIVHSRGDPTLPGEGSAMPWPVAAGCDLARYSAWTNWLGFFAPELQADFVAASSRQTGLGVARIFPRATVPGVKLFAFGADFADRASYTDDGRDYFEIWGGPNRTFWDQDRVMLPAGGALGWTEVWSVFAEMGKIEYANEHVVLHIAAPGDSAVLGVASSSARTVQVVITRGERELYRGAADVAPASPLRQELGLRPAELAGAQVQILDDAGDPLATYVVPEGA